MSFFRSLFGGGIDDDQSVVDEDDFPFLEPCGSFEQSGEVFNLGFQSFVFQFLSSAAPSAPPAIQREAFRDDHPGFDDFGAYDSNDDGIDNDPAATGIAPTGFPVQDQQHRNQPQAQPQPQQQTHLSVADRGSFFSQFSRFSVLPGQDFPLNFTPNIGSFYAGAAVADSTDPENNNNDNNGHDDDDDDDDAVNIAYQPQTHTPEDGEEDAGELSDNDVKSFITPSTDSSYSDSRIQQQQPQQSEQGQQNQQEQGGDDDEEEEQQQQQPMGYWTAPVVPPHLAKPMHSGTAIPERRRQHEEKNLVLPTPTPWPQSAGQLPASQPENQLHQTEPTTAAPPPPPAQPQLSATEPARPKRPDLPPILPKPRAYHQDRFRIQQPVARPSQRQAQAVHNQELLLIQHNQAAEEKHKQLLRRMAFAVDVNTSSDDFINLTKDKRPVKPREHFSCLSYGKVLTILAVLSCLLGLILAVLSKRSYSFVRLRDPLRISPHLDNVHHVGLVDLKLCYNESAKVIDPALDGISLLVNETETDYQTFRQKGCYDFHLTAEVVDDAMWNVARSFLSIAIALGSFLTLMLFTSILWESINLKPIAVGLLVTYFSQSLSFFFFDSDLCRQHICSVSSGSTMSICSSVCWFAAGLLCIRMDVVYQSKQRLLAKRYRRARRKEYARLKTELVASQQPNVQQVSDESASVGATLPSSPTTPMSTPPKNRSTDDIVFAEDVVDHHGSNEQQQQLSSPDQERQFLMNCDDPDIESAIRMNFSDPSVGTSHYRNH